MCTWATTNSVTLPWRAGESHMDLGKILRWDARWILRTTPEPKGESHGEIQSGVSRAAGPSGSQFAARSAGGPGYCAGSSAVRGGELRRHGGFWSRQGEAVAPVPAAGARDS